MSRGVTISVFRQPINSYLADWRLSSSNMQLLRALHKHPSSIPKRRSKRKKNLFPRRASIKLKSIIFSGRKQQSTLQFKVIQRSSPCNLQLLVWKIRIKESLWQRLKILRKQTAILKRAATISDRATHLLVMTTTILKKKTTKTTMKTKKMKPHLMHQTIKVKCILGCLIIAMMTETIKSESNGVLGRILGSRGICQAKSRMIHCIRIRKRSKRIWAYSMKPGL